MKPAPPAFLLLLLGATACAHRITRFQAGSLALPVASLEADSIANVLIQRAFAADGHLLTPDSTYNADTEIIADGELRSEPPRLAGVSDSGSVQLGSSRIAIQSNFIWGTIEYRWIAATDHHLVNGRATVVVGRNKDGDWRILHLHSSTQAQADSI